MEKKMVQHKFVFCLVFFKSFFDQNDEDEDLFKLQFEIYDLIFCLKLSTKSATKLANSCV